ncbi:MAG TPA: hypothetical protein VN153_12810 [Tahibacter sp.]|nr:hypothetical protein [Tahibacter sp.]
MRFVRFIVKIPFVEIRKLGRASARTPPCELVGGFVRYTGGKPIPAHALPLKGRVFRFVERQRFSPIQRDRHGNVPCAIERLSGADESAPAPDSSTRESVGKPVFRNALEE